jgi:hypothetical protein
MFPFSKLGPFDRTEKKALLFALLFSVLFIVLLSVSVPVKRIQRKRVTLLSTTPVTTPFEPSESSFGDPLEKFRLVSGNFREIDFKNFSYGVHVISNGKPVSLTLSEGKMWDDTGWFNLQDVYYKDITGDGSPEAIVRLLHLRCNGSCDGGADVFYVYSMRNGKLKNIWQYETGSYAYGCGLKSFTLGKRQMVLELFGECARQSMTYPGPAKFTVKDLTFMLFEFDGHRFITKTIEYIPEPSRNVKNWEPEIRIY